MDRSEFEVRVKSATESLLNGLNVKGYVFNPDLNGVDDNHVIDFYYHVLEDLQNRAVITQESAAWLFENFTNNLDGEDEFSCKLFILERFGQLVYERRDLLEKFTKPLNGEQKERIIDLDGTIQVDVWFVLLKLMIL